MHLKNKHTKNYNFSALIKVNPALEKYIILNEYDKVETIDFSNAKAVKALNFALLKANYDVNYWSFPEENLCPPIPSRVDYLYYVADVLKKTKISSTFSQKNTLLDIGTGATLIYALLGVKEFKWNFIATDCEQTSLQNAKIIAKENQLENKIQLRFQDNKENILTNIITKEDLFLASVCNPPFYASAREAQGANSRRTFNLNLENKRNFKGTSNELWYKGGEKAFLHNYLYQSSLVKENCLWFTSLVSKKENVKSMETSLKKLKTTSFKVIPMQHGNKATRIVAWSFMV